MIRYDPVEIPRLRLPRLAQRTVELQAPVTPCGLWREPPRKTVQLRTHWTLYITVAPRFRRLNERWRLLQLLILRQWLLLKFCGRSSVMKISQRTLNSASVMPCGRLMSCWTVLVLVRLTSAVILLLKISLVLLWIRRYMIKSVLPIRRCGLTMTRTWLRVLSLRMPQTWHSLCLLTFLLIRL